MALTVQSYCRGAAQVPVHVDTPILGIQDVVNVDSLSVQHRSAGDTAPVERHTFLAGGDRNRTIRSHGPMSLLIKTQNLRIDRIAQPRCPLGNRVKQRLKITCRRGDHPQDVIGGASPAVTIPRVLAAPRQSFALSWIPALSLPHGGVLLYCSENLF